jgi:hypothetical protein
MSADISTGTWIPEDSAHALEVAPARPDAKYIPGILQLRVAAEVEDALALLRTAVILARHFGVSLVLDLPNANSGSIGSANSGMELHPGSAPCSAMLSALLHSVEQRLRKLSSGANKTFLVEFGFLAESRGFLYRIRTAGPVRQSRSQCPATAAENSTVSNSSQSK